MNLDKNIGWCTHTHNIMTGCLNKKLGICNVAACYAQQTAENPFYRKAFPYGFEPHFYDERIRQVAKLHTPAIIFMDSMSDLFGSWWTDEQILKILHIMDCMRGVHWHKYVVLTKNPVRMAFALKDYMNSEGVERLKNVYFGTSVSGEDCMIERDRLVFLRKISAMGYKTVISFEPLLYNPLDLIIHARGIGCADWIIIGGQTKPTKIPEEQWIVNIARETYPKQPVFVKKNCGGEYGNHFHDFPADLLPIAQAWGKV
jgi:protein gp37